MRKTITVNGKGATIQQARIGAYATLKADYKNNILVYSLTDSKEIVAPKPGSQCTTTNNPPQGARKWETKHIVYGINPVNPDDIKKFAEFDDKTSALKEAKAMALKHQVEVQVRVEKIQTNLGTAGLPAGISAVVVPKMTEGLWEFTLDVEVLH